MTPGQRAPALLEELDVVEPPPIHLPPLLQAQHGRERLLDRPERPHLPLYLHVLNDEPGVDQYPPRPLFIVRKARSPPSLPPLVRVKRHECQHTPRSQRAPGPRDDRVRHTEMSDKEIGPPPVVLHSLRVS